MVDDKFGNIKGREYVLMGVVDRTKFALGDASCSYDLFEVYRGKFDLNQLPIAVANNIVNLADRLCEKGEFLSAPRDKVTTSYEIDCSRGRTRVYGPVSTEKVVELINEWEQHQHIGEVVKDREKRLGK